VGADGPLRGMAIPVVGADAAAEHATRLLAFLGADVVAATADRPGGTHEAWAASGAVPLTGDPDGPPRSPRWSTAAAMEGAAALFASLTERLGRRVDVDGAALLGERAAHTGAGRTGQVSPGGSCRMVEAADGWLAVNLARPDDVGLLAAWLEAPDHRFDDPWPAVRALVARRSALELEERAGWMGLPVAVVRSPPGAPAAPFSFTSMAAPAVAFADLDDLDDRRPLVVDLSSLWAGPLCANLLGLAGAIVVKVESATRPDGARQGSPTFYDLLHARHHSIAVPFTEPAGRAVLRELVGLADVVVDASRPRAMEQLEIDVDELVALGTTWVGITAYGRTGEARNRVGFGDDVAAAAGLVAGDRDRPLFVADAVADPIAGLHAAIAAVASLLAGGGHLVDVSMRAAAASTAGVPSNEILATPSATSASGWVLDGVDGGPPLPVAAPRTRPSAGRAAPTAELVADRVGLRRVLQRERIRTRG